MLGVRAKKTKTLLDGDEVIAEVEGEVCKKKKLTRLVNTGH
jgi:hypothetical protein